MIERSAQTGRGHGIFQDRSADVLKGRGELKVTSQKHMHAEKLRGLSLQATKSSCKLIGAYSKGVQEHPQTAGAAGAEAAYLLSRRESRARLGVKRRSRSGLVLRPR